MGSNKISYSLEEYMQQRTKVNEDGCHYWQGTLNQGGYGMVWYKAGTAMAHRVAYELATGEPIPPNTTIDHLCQTRDCVNPDHLEAVSQQVNTQRRWQRTETIMARIKRIEDHLGLEIWG